MLLLLFAAHACTRNAAADAQCAALDSGIIPAAECCFDEGFLTDDHYLTDTLGC